MGAAWAPDGWAQDADSDFEALFGDFDDEPEASDESASGDESGGSSDAEGSASASQPGRADARADEQADDQPDERAEAAPEPLTTIPVESATTAATPAPRSNQLEEIVVRANKVEQSLRDVAASVTALDGKLLERINIAQPNDLNGYVPNASFKIAPFGGEIRIRGFGTPINNAGFESAVGLVVDDVYYGRTAFFGSLLFDVGQLEVLRGPQGALFGKNTVAGVVNVISRQPEVEFGGSITAFAESDSRIASVEASTGGALSDAMLVRLAVATVHVDELVFNTLLQRPELNLVNDRAKLTVIHDQFFGDGELSLVVNYADQVLNNNLFQLLSASDDSLEYFRDFDPLVEVDPFDERLSSNVPAVAATEVRTARVKAVLPMGTIGRFEDFELVGYEAHPHIKAPVAV